MDEYLRCEKQYPSKISDLILVKKDGDFDTSSGGKFSDGTSIDSMWRNGVNLLAIPKFMASAVAAFQSIFSFLSII